MKQVCPVTQWHDERDKGERDREIIRWMRKRDLERQMEILTIAWNKYQGYLHRPIKHIQYLVQKEKGSNYFKKRNTRTHRGQSGIMQRPKEK